MTWELDLFLIDGEQFPIDGTRFLIDGDQFLIDGLSTGWRPTTGPHRLLGTVGDKIRRPGGHSVTKPPSIRNWRSDAPWSMRSPLAGDAGTLARSPRCHQQHDAQRCRYGMTKGIDARMGRDSERGSMRSTKARPRLRRGEPERSWLKQAARRHHRPCRHPRPRRRPLAVLAARRAARPDVSSPAAGRTYPAARQDCIPVDRWTRSSPAT